MTIAFKILILAKHMRREFGFDSKRGQRSKVRPDLNLSKVAEEAGISRSYLSQLFRGERANISLEVATKLGRALGVPTDRVREELEKYGRKNGRSRNSGRNRGRKRVRAA